MRICVNSQTPFVRFKLNLNDLLDKYGPLPDPVDIKDLEEGVDYDYTPGGVTAMVYPLVKNMMSRKIASKVTWVSLGVNYPPRVQIGDILVSHIQIPEDVLLDYTAFKENLWLWIHGFPGELAFDRWYAAYSRYNWANAEKLLEVRNEADVFYVQDFQLLQTGGIIGPPAPAVLRWHVPFTPEALPLLTHRAVTKWVESFDAIVVSTRRDLEGLVKSAYRGRAHQVYPFVDPDDWKEAPTEAAIDQVKQRVGLRGGEELLLMVARMDRIKSQDVAIRALSHLKNRGRFRLALIGDGSFSSTKSGGLGHGKGERWRAELVGIVKDLGMQDKVSFLGHVSRDELRAAYSISSVVLLTSNLEGFGITALEGWMNKKPVVVSKGAGVSELVIDGSNGYTFPSGDDQKAAEAIFKAHTEGDKLGENGLETSKQCYIGVAVEKEKAILEEAISIYK
ncbi:MAG: glycosyltransferase family 4 protein [Thaumarchaeota archaeon]|nr:glycosyltransferase family 4 protein [Nitrososphaerota archaeon]